MSRERLESLLQAAIELELATIPPYLCALYSIRSDANDQARLIIRSVVVEEMLHLLLAANVLNAIGGHPIVGGPDHTPRYPHELPSGVVLDLLPFSPAAIDAFLKVENPEYPHGTMPDDHPAVVGRRPRRHLAPAASSGPSTIGAFYEEIIHHLEDAAASEGNRLFCGDPARQVTARYYYAGGGGLFPVVDLTSARRALNEVIDQGEGNPASMYDVDGDLAHYYRFEQIARGRAYVAGDSPGCPTGATVSVDWDAVYPMLTNPTSDDVADPDLRAVSDLSNRTWSLLLRQVDMACNGRPETLLPAVHGMFRLRDQVLTLLGNPLADPRGRHAGPMFVWDLTDE